MMVSSSSSSSSLVSAAPLTIHNKLQSILQNQQRYWNHAIYWQTYRNGIDNNRCSSSSLSLVWREGYYQSMTSPSTHHHQPNKRLSIDYEGLLPMDDDIVVSDAEWFYITSSSKRYSLDQTSSSSGALANAFFMSGSFLWLSGANALRSYNCERTNEGYSHGLRTLVCIPVLDGVLELGSVEVIKEDRALVQQAQSLFGPSKDLDVGSTQLWTSIDGEINTTNNNNHNYQQTFVSLLEECDLSEPISPQRVGKKKGRKPGTGRDKKAATTHHVEAERLRRERMSIRFCDLRAVVPVVSKMDKTSLLGDTVIYIKKLKDKIEDLESQLKMSSSTNDNPSTSESGRNNNGDYNNNNSMPLKVEVRVFGNGAAMIRFEFENVNHPAARLMNVLKVLNLQVYHASVSTVEQLMFQDVVVVNVPEELNNDDLLKVAITSRLGQ